jgi:hypothetical protein
LGKIFKLSKVIGGEAPKAKLGQGSGRLVDRDELIVDSTRGVRIWKGPVIYPFRKFFHGPKKCEPTFLNVRDHLSNFIK